MFRRRLPFRHAFFIRLALMVTILPSLIAGGFDSFTAANARFPTASPFFATCSPPCVENFDSVAIPNLPPGWSATPVSALTWRTVNTAFASSPNSAFANAPSHIVDNRLISPTFAAVSSPAVLSFRRSNSLETNFDGMVLEISIDGGAFVDILNAGGSFTGGSGYNATINNITGNPLGGRMAWTGATAGFVTTSVNLPVSATARSFTFRWRVATDDSIGGAGAFIDSVTLTEPPANDNLRNAQPILSATGVSSSTNVGATKEAFELDHHAGKPGGSSVWFRWQAPESGRFVFTTFGSSFDTILAVYTGEGFPLNKVISNDIDPGLDLTASCGSNRISKVSFSAVTGVVYRIAVDRASSTTGSIVLRWGRSASISGKVTDASEREIGGEVRLIGDTCQRHGFSRTFGFSDVPTGGNYSAFARNPSDLSHNFEEYPTNESISPLTGDVSDFNFFLRSPTKTISGKVTMTDGSTLTGFTVNCVANGPTAVISATATVTGSDYICSSLPIHGDYVVTPSKPGVRFLPLSRTIHLFPIDNAVDVDFSGTQTHTISGRITHPNGINGVGGISISLSGSQTATRATDANGNYSFTDLAPGGNYTLTPSNANFTFTPPSLSFNNLVANQTANFTGTASLQLILDELGQVAALDSVLLMRDPFPVINNANLLNRGVDRNTRVAVFVSNFQLGPGELPSSVVINLVGSNNQTYDIPAEDVRPLSNGFTQVTFRLPNTLTVGICTLVVKARGLTSNLGAMRVRD